MGGQLKLTENSGESKKKKRGREVQLGKTGPKRPAWAGGASHKKRIFFLART